MLCLTLVRVRGVTLHRDGEERGWGGGKSQRALSE